MRSTSSLLTVLAWASSLCLILSNNCAVVMAASEEEDQTKISTNKHCFESGEKIIARFINQFPQYNDRVALYLSSDDGEVDDGENVTSLHDNGIWVWACSHDVYPNGKKCPQWGKFRFQFQGAPLAAGSYKLVLVREMGDEEEDEDLSSVSDSSSDSPPVYNVVAASKHFVVKHEGETCDSKAITKNDHEDHHETKGLRGSTVTQIIKIEEALLS